MKPPDFADVADIHSIDFHSQADVDAFIRAAAIERVKAEGSVPSFYGIRVVTRPEVPEGEIWMMDGNGKIKRIFTLPHRE